MTMNKVGFNSIVVRLKALSGLAYDSNNKCFNSIVVRLKANHSDLQYRYSLGFNSIVVRLKDGNRNGSKYNGQVSIP